MILANNFDGRKINKIVKKNNKHADSSTMYCSQTRRVADRDSQLNSSRNLEYPIGQKLAFQGSVK